MYDQAIETLKRKFLFQVFLYGNNHGLDKYENAELEWLVSQIMSWSEVTFQIDGKSIEEICSEELNNAKARTKQKRKDDLNEAIIDK
jgi:hypothetical protein